MPDLAQAAQDALNSAQGKTHAWLINLIVAHPGKSSLVLLVLGGACGFWLRSVL